MTLYPLVCEVPPTVSALDYYTGLVGSFVAGLFCFLLAYLIRDARRSERTDRVLALTMDVFGAIAWYGTYHRFATWELIPYASPILWVALSVCCIITTFHMLRERRMRRKALQNEANR